MNDLTLKQLMQIYNVCGMYQPAQDFEDVVFLKIVNAARGYCDSAKYPLVNEAERFDKVFKADMEKIKERFYYFGFKPIKGRSLDDLHKRRILKYLHEMLSRPYENLTEGNPEKSFFVMVIVRACKKYLAGGMSAAAEDELRAKLGSVRRALDRTPLC